jgi:hypothetical protein
MKTFRFYGSKDLRVEDVAAPKICGPRSWSAVSRRARRVRDDALAGLPNAAIEATIRVLRHICREVAGSDEPDHE